MILFQPSAGQIAVSETFLFKNDGKTTWNDPDSGTLKFFLPAGARASRRSTPPRPAACPSARRSNKTSKPDVFEVDFPIKPGETRFDLTYPLPYTEGADLRGQGGHQGREHLPDRAQRRHAEGRRPRTIWARSRAPRRTSSASPPAAYKVQLTGAVAAAPAEAAAAIRPPTTADRASSRSCRGCTTRRSRSWRSRSASWRSASPCSIAPARRRACSRRPVHRGPRMNAVAVEGVWKFYGDYPALRDVELHGRAGRVPRADRPQRRGQDHAAAHHRRLLAARHGTITIFGNDAARNRDAPPDRLHRPRHLASTTSSPRSRT